MRIPRKRISFYLQHFAFCFSSYFSSSSGSAPLQPPQSAAAWPWSSQCRRNSDWGSPEGRRIKFVEPFGYELQPEVTRNPPPKKSWWGGIPLLSLLAGKRCQARHSLVQKRRVDSVYLFSVMTLVFAAFPAPFTIETHPPFTQAHKASSVLLNTFHFSVSLLTFS